MQKEKLFKITLRITVSTKTQFLLYVADQNEEQHAQLLCQLLIEDESQEIKDMKMSIATYYKQFIRVIVSVGYQVTNIPKIL